MANIIAGAQRVQRPAQVQPSQSTAKIAKRSSDASKSKAAPQDTVTISSEGHAAQIVAQTNSGGGGKK